MSGRPWAEVLQEFMDKVTQQDAAQAAEIDALVKAHRLDEAKRWERLLERNVEAANDTASEWKERAEKAEASVARLQHWRDRAEKAEAWAEKAEAEVAGLRAIRFDDANRAEKAELRVLATEAEKRAEKAERDLDNWQYHARSADAEAVRVARIADEWQERAEKAEAEVDELKRQLDLLRPTNPPPQRGTGDVWQEIIDSLSPSHPMRAACIKRREVGIARYGHPLQYGNGRNGDQDLEEELLDAAAFAWLRGLQSFAGYLVNAAFDPAKWWAFLGEYRDGKTACDIAAMQARLDDQRAVLRRGDALLAEAHASLVDLLTHGDDAPAASYQRAAKVADAIAGGAR